MPLKPIFMPTARGILINYTCTIKYKYLNRKPRECHNKNEVNLKHPEEEENSGPIGPVSFELPAFEGPNNFQLTYNGESGVQAVNSLLIGSYFLQVTRKSHEILAEFEWRPNWMIHLGVACH